MILAVDPGKCTGWATWTLDGPVTVSQAENDVFLPFADALMESLGDDLVIVCEAYIISADTLRKSRQTWSLEVIGALRYLAHKHGCEFAPLQRASDAKNVVPDDRLRDLGLYERGKEHGRDAARHLVLYLMKVGQVNPADLV